MISYGGTSRACLDINKSNNIACLLINKLHPLNKSEFLKIVKDFKNILVIEDQMQYNNLYSSISELIINTKNKPNLFQICPTKYELTVGNSQEFFYKKFKMDKISIISKIKKII